MKDKCKCGATLGREGKCPRLCEPVPQPPPVYTGPMVVGLTHIGKIGKPVYTPPKEQNGYGWIG